MVKMIHLTHGKSAIVDDVDYDWLSRWKWSFDGHYAAMYLYDKDTGKVTKVRMHKFIMQPENGIEVDHRDTNKLNYCRLNLRLATKSQNNMNRKPYTGSSSKYKGVYWDKSKKRWASEIAFNKIRKKLGRFKNEIDAATAYDAAAKLYHGEFARLNFP